MTYIDPSTWFDPLGQCRCGKPATGILRGDSNQSMGVYCSPCANARLKKAKQERANALKQATSTAPNTENT